MSVGPTGTDLPPARQMRTLPSIILGGLPPQRPGLRAAATQLAQSQVQEDPPGSGAAVQSGHDVLLNAAAVKQPLTLVKYTASVR